MRSKVVTLCEGYGITSNYQQKNIDYMTDFKQFGRLSKELHNRIVTRVTERYIDMYTS